MSIVTLDEEWRMERAFEALDYRSTTRFHTARKNYTCDTDSDYPVPCQGIQAGDRYAVISFAPGSEPFYSEKWQSLRECQRCAKNYGRLIPSLTGPAE